MLTKSVTIEVHGCSDCPYYGTEQGGVMVCNHPKAPQTGYGIIQRYPLDSWGPPKSFPPKCPL